MLIFDCRAGPIMECYRADVEGARYHWNCGSVLGIGGRTIPSTGKTQKNPIELLFGDLGSKVLASGPAPGIRRPVIPGQTVFEE